MANAAFRDVSFLLRRSHNEQVAKILSDPEASEDVYKRQHQAYILALYRHRPELICRMKAIIDRYAEENASDTGTIGHHTLTMHFVKTKFKSNVSKYQ